jgi:cytidylate kinase
VLDGRDIGTVIAPGAQVKIFVVATPEARAGRRHRELIARGETTSYDAVLADIRRRDARDTGRTDAPLRAAPDAVTLDTTEMDVDTAFAAALALVRARTTENG